MKPNRPLPFHCNIIKMNMSSSLKTKRNEREGDPQYPLVMVIFSCHIWVISSMVSADVNTELLNCQEREGGAIKHI
jgi:hypothetical protein